MDRVPEDKLDGETAISFRKKSKGGGVDNNADSTSRKD
jgi:hypothetical protein